MSNPESFIVDIDGTLADHEGIRGHYEYEKVSQDKPVTVVIEVVKLLAMVYIPIFVSGRMDIGNCREDTVDWLVKYMDIYPYPLFMRPATLSDGNPDYRPDYVVKGEIYRDNIKPYYDVRFAIDDRLQVCQMWHRIGIPVFRVGDPDANF